MKPILFLLAIICISCSPKKSVRPNVLFILTDDQGWGDISSHGNTIIETPVMDQLGRDGAEFENFFVSPLCAPTRASLLTGRYHLKTGTTSVSNGMEIMDSEETTLAEIFKANGYATGIFGKWHNGSHYPHRPADQGFDEFIGFCAGHWSNYFDTKLDSLNIEIQSTGYITDFLTDRAIDFIDRNQEEPFFCYVPYNAPHSPFQVPDDYFNKYKAKGLDDRLASVYGMVENVDDNIKRLLDKLDTEGLTENTIVIFMTDNGPNGERYNGNMKGIKGHVDEGGVRVPSIIKWPGHIEAGRRISSISAHIDWFPTLKDLCNLDDVDGRKIDGQSLVNLLLKDQETETNRTLFTHVAFLEKDLKPAPGAIRTDQYRFVLKEKPELYDMCIDPGQQNNISLENPEQTARFQAQYLTWFQDASKNYQSVKPVNINTDFIELPTYEAQFSGNLRFEEGHGWAHDWLKNWKSSEDEMSWLIKSDQEIELEAFLTYTVPELQKGSTIALSVGRNTLNATISEAFDPPIVQSPDRVKRKEAYEKEWAEMSLGKILIPAGTELITLRAKEIASAEVAEVKSIILKSLP